MYIIEAMRYIPANGFQRPEMVAMDLRRSDGKESSGVFMVEPFLEEGVRTIIDLTTIDYQPLDDAQTLEVLEFIRQKRNMYRFAVWPKTYEQWDNLALPLEDYLPLGFRIDKGFLDNLGYITPQAKNLLQITTPYTAPYDRAPLKNVYHTFLWKNGGWNYQGVCAQDSPINLVPELHFYAKLLLSGPEQTIYYSDERLFRSMVNESNTFGRPCEAVYLSRSRYLQELKTAGCGENGGPPIGPIRDEDIIREANAILWRLDCVQPPMYSGTTKPMCRVNCSQNFQQRANAADFDRLVEELPFPSAQWRTSNAEGKSVCFVIFPLEDWKAHTNLGIWKDYRDESGKLSIPVSEVEQQMQELADRYYVSGQEYIYKGILFTYYRYWDHTPEREPCEMGVFIDGVHRLFCAPSQMGTFLPDVASEGMEYIAVDDERYQPLPTLPKHTRAYVEEKLAGQKSLFPR